LGVGRKVLGVAILLAWLAAVVWLIPPAATLASLEQVDDYPLYTMHYHGGYQRAMSTARFLESLLWAGRASLELAPEQPAWACSLFAALGDADNEVYGRNFDWHYSPALLLFSDPPDGYASVSMVNIAYLGYAGNQLRALVKHPLIERSALLLAPLFPLDGMNEYGLAIGMAAVPPGGMRPDPNKETLDSLMIIREMLDHARDVDEAVDIMSSYNVDMRGGPPIHYLVADASGRAALVEFYQGEMHVFPNHMPWHLATNFLRAAAGDSPEGHCWRYDRINERLRQTEGRMTSQEAMNLLADVSQGGTQWSVVYEMNSGAVNVAMGRAYEQVHTFSLMNESAGVLQSGAGVGRKQGRPRSGGAGDQAKAGQAQGHAPTLPELMCGFTWV
jgi:hypothetical protein